MPVNEKLSAMKLVREFYSLVTMDEMKALTALDRQQLAQEPVKVKYISRDRADYLMGALGLMGGTLISGIGVERRMVVQPIGSDIADGREVSSEDALGAMRITELFFGDMGADMDAIKSARKRLGAVR